MAQLLVAAPPMCSVLAKAAGEDPIGSATTFEQLIVLEVPLPWPRVVRQARRFPPAAEAAIVVAEAAKIPHKLLFVVPSPEYSPPGLTRVLHLRRPAGAFRSYAKSDYLVPAAAVGELIAALLGEPARLARFASLRQDSTAIRDLLVCTHGSRDRCCGSLGYPLYNRLRRELQAAPDQQVRVWRVGHLGGHRFAPTLLDLPSGRFWAHLAEEDAILRLLYRAPAPPALACHYRGWAAMRSLPEMVAERALFSRFGWDWTTRAVGSEIVSRSEAGDETTVRLSYESISAGSGAVEVTVAPSGDVSRNPGSCGDPTLSEHKHYHVIGWDERLLPI